MEAEQLAAAYVAKLAALLDKLQEDPDIVQVIAMSEELERLDAKQARRLPNAKPLGDVLNTLRAGVPA